MEKADELRNKRIEAGRKGGRVSKAQAPLKQKVSTAEALKETKGKETKVKERTIEERKEEFKKLTKNKWEELGGSSYLSTAETKAFFEYWSEHSEADKKMRFEKEKSFGVGRRLGTWKKNNQKPSNPNVRKNA